jgi:hypothetical protein
VSAPTIGRIREELRREQEYQPSTDQVVAAGKSKSVQLVREPEIRVDRRGREFEVKPAVRSTSREDIGHSACPNCGSMLTIFQNLDGVYLRYDHDK